MNNRVYIKSVAIATNPNKNGYWCKLPFYKELAKGKEINFDSPITFIIGENGSGKSTLIEGLSVALGYNAEGGSKNFCFSTKNSTSQLYNDLIIAKSGYEEDGFFLRAESLYNVATNIDDLNLNINNYGGKSLHNQSHGESFLSLVENRFRGNGLYILDEPEAALSPMRQLKLIMEINRLVNSNSQFIIATHSPILLSFPNAKIYCIDNGIEEKNFKETEHYTVTKSFLDNPESYLHKLLKEYF